jgi:hypothetical protein
VSNALLIYLSEDRTCAQTSCQKTIKAGEKAIRKSVKETKSESAHNEYFHEKCYGGK